MAKQAKEKRKSSSSGASKKSEDGRGKARRSQPQGNVGDVIGRSAELQASLDRVVQGVAGQVGTEVCSLYLYDRRTRRLTLWATRGLDKAAIGKVGMGLEEGLTGLVMQRREPVMVVDAIAHPRYKYFPETGEERYHSFLGVPVVVNRRPVGVLVVQTLRRRDFQAEEIQLLRGIATRIGKLLTRSQISETIRNRAREQEEYRRGLLEAIQTLEAPEKTGAAAQKEGATREPQRFRLLGLGASPGYGMGPAHVLRSLFSSVDLDSVSADDPGTEWERFQSAVKQSIEEVESLKSRFTDEHPDVDPGLFDSHRKMLEDESFLDKIRHQVQNGIAAVTALQNTIDETVSVFGRMTDRYLRERAIDVKDIGSRVLRNLLGVGGDGHQIPSGAILVAEELTLSDLALLDHEDLGGIVLASGGVTSHASILAKSFEIPTVVGVEPVLESVGEGDFLIVDGNSGIVYQNPTEDIVGEYRRLQTDYRRFNLELETLHDLPAETKDGRRVVLAANIGLLGDVDFAQRHGAQGVGLYRTEFPFLTYQDFPDEEEQLRLYREVIERLGSRRITIRTLDIGADKYPSYLRLGKEENPFLGWRSIRVSLEQPDLFKVQLRAVLRASVHGDVRLLFPMISSLDEVLRVKEILVDAREELRKEGTPFDEKMPIGVMIEVPAAVALAPRLAQEVDFFSLGTNDLIQYVLAVDRNNRKVAPLYEPLHPAVIMAIDQTVRAAKTAGIPVSLCGEMAADPASCLVLLGIGILELSMEPFSIPLIKRMIRSIRYEDAQKVADAVIEMRTVTEIKGYLFEVMRDLEILELMEIYH